MSRDRIEKKIVLKAPRERVWRAISDSRQFGAWFGAELDGPFTVGRWLTGRIMPTTVDPEVAKLQEPHRGTPWRVLVERIEPMECLSFRWHPFAIDTGKDYSSEPTTLVTFTLRDAGAGTELTITESGFDRLPLERRAQTFEANDGGWAHQVRLIEKYLAHGAAA